MLIVALVLAVIGLAALVTAVVTSNEVIAWVCIGASALGVVLLVVDAVRERQSRRVAAAPAEVLDAVEQDASHDDADADAADAADVADDTADESDSAPTEFVTDSGDGAEAESDGSDSAGDEGIADDDAEAVADDTETVADDAEAEADEFAEEIAAEDHPDELVHDEPEYDTYSDDEPDYPEPAEESAVHTVTEGRTEDR